MTILRPYQEEAIQSVLSYWDEGGGNPLVAAATGVGKSIIIAELIRRLHEINPSIRVLVLVHVKELVAQNAKELMRLYPTCSIGINSAGLGRRDIHQRVLFASIQSVYKSAKTLGRFDVVLIDEAHLVPHSGDGMYRRLINDLMKTQPDLRVSGFTATPYRLDSGRLDRGEGRLFDRLVFEYGIAEGIRDNYLSPLISKATLMTMDVSGVAKRGGEFVSGALEVAVDQDWITKAAISEVVEAGKDRKSWLVFCVGVSHAEHVRDEVRSRGVSCEMVTGETPAGERDRIIDAFKRGEIRCLTNAMVLTTGFNAPAVDLVVMLRPTLSPGLYIQIVGRGTRQAPGKENCLVLDFAGNVRRHGPVDAVDVKDRKPGSGDGDPLAKDCPECKTLVALNARVCPTCGHEFPVNDLPVKHEASADVLPILSREPPFWATVDDMRLFKHNKIGGIPSVRAEFLCGLMTYKTWLCFDHTGYARSKAVEFWRDNAGTEPPASVDEALARKGELSAPAEIRLRSAGKHYEVIGYRMRRRAA